MSLSVRSDVLALLRQSAHCLEDPMPRVAAEHIYDRFAHHRAGLPLSLLEQGPSIFADSLARAARTAGQAWADDYSGAWTELIAQGVAIQRDVYDRPDPTALPDTAAVPRGATR